MGNVFIFLLIKHRCLNPNYIYINSHWIIPNQISVYVVDWKSIMVTTRKHNLHRKQNNNASNVLYKYVDNVRDFLL